MKNVKADRTHDIFKASEIENEYSIEKASGDLCASKGLTKKKKKEEEVNSLLELNWKKRKAERSCTEMKKRIE